MDITVLLGAPGAGKGTVAARIAPALNARHVSTGAMLREAVKAGTPAGLSAKAYMDKGELVPDQVLADMIGELLAQAPADARFLLDGFPRNVAQAETLDRLAAAHGATVARALSVDVTPETVLERLGGRRTCPKCGEGYHIKSLPPKVEGICDKCGAELVIRKDDNPDTVKDRLVVYHQQTEPLIAYYKDKGLLRTVDGTTGVENVAAAFLAAM
jgi:adenylate kinase